MVRFVMELEGLKQEKQDVISRAVVYYREALAEKNPFQRITTLFSCIQVIVRDVVQENEVKPRHIYDILDDYVKLERKQSRDHYGKFRSAAAHGQEDILDSSKIREAEEIAEKVLMITFRLIREYAKRNKQQQQQQQTRRTEAMKRCGISDTSSSNEGSDSIPIASLGTRSEQLQKKRNDPYAYLKSKDDAILAQYGYILKEDRIDFTDNKTTISGGELERERQRRAEELKKSREKRTK